MAGTPALKALDKAKVSYQLHSYDHDPANRHFGEETVEVLGVDPKQAFKTLVADLVGAKSPTACAVVPVAGHLDLKALAAAAGAKKASMTDPAAAERLTGYVVGGISPLGQKKRMPIFIDESATELETMIVSGGRRGLSVEIAPQVLADLLQASFADIGRPGPAPR